LIINKHKKGEKFMKRKILVWAVAVFLLVAAIVIPPQLTGGGPDDPDNPKGTITFSQF
jgi:hypothetical protein